LVWNLTRLRLKKLTDSVLLIILLQDELSAFRVRLERPTMASSTLRRRRNIRTEPCISTFRPTVHANSFTKTKLFEKAVQFEEDENAGCTLYCGQEHFENGAFSKTKTSR